ncbi:hypothetical protein ACO2Q3_03530 [Caulobacter sp. KR2-114]|uniref:hypothetical protein n=1 Tax=Caulobacter sp. KR2-114 TaxID=3400912 RepID=UPI003BFBD234
MTTITPVSAAVTSAFSRFDQASADLARSANQGQELSAAIGAQISAKEVVGASIALQKTQDEMTQSLLDITV